MPVYKDEKLKTYFYVFYTGKDLITGKPKRVKKRGFATEKEANKAMIKAMNDFNEGDYIEPSKKKLGDYLVNVWLPLRKDLGRATVIVYEGYIKNQIINSGFGENQLSKLTSNHIQAFIILLRKTLSENTVKRVYSLLRSSLQDAVTMKLIKENPATTIVGKPKYEQPEIQVWNKDECRIFLDSIIGRSRYSLAIRLALFTGMRQGEVLGLRWKAIDFDNKMISITHTASHDGKEIRSKTKTKSSRRSIPIDEETLKELVRHRKLINEERKTVPDYQDNDLVFCTSTGRICTPRNLMRAFYDFLKENKVPKIRFHDLRHTHATLLLRSGINPKIVSERLGHSSVKITLDTYSHMLPDIQEKAVESMNLLLN
ncbi:site-specific integrase [Marinicrinis sediminis]|uniref:Tyrosine-type recombinase/integrase n=1 Tax=Marinicrinis sediminis TaxID=1652465 RepID=A0ABW5R9Q6_9BACL